MTDKSVAQRNVTIGSLIITMPRVNKLTTLSVKKSEVKKPIKTIRATPEVSKREYLEIGPRKEDLNEFLMVVNKKETKVMKIVDENFTDNPDVPPLECLPWKGRESQFPWFPWGLVGLAA